MISKLTQLLGEVCLILSQNRTAFSYAVVKKSRPQNSQPGGKFSQILLILLVSFIGFNNEAFSQCDSPDTTNPVAVCTTIFTVALDSNGDGSLTVQDVDAGSSDGCGIASFQLDNSTFTCADLGSSNLQVELTVTDLSGNTNTCNSLIVLADNLAPTLTCPADISVACGSSTATTDTGNPTVMDNCGLLSITFADVALTGTAGMCDGIERTFTATDNDNNSNTCVQIIEITDSADPVLDFGTGVTPPADITLSCSDPIPTAPTATMTDDCTATATITAVDDNQQINNSQSCDFYNYNIVRTWTGTDNCGKTVVHTQTITIENEPQFTGATTALNLSAISTVACPSGCAAAINLDLTSELVYNCGINGSQLLSTDFEVEDAAGATVYSGNGLIINSVCLGVGVYDANFSAEDHCGNITTHTVVITIEDNIPPNANCTNSIQIGLPSVGMYVIDPLNDLDNNSTDNCATQLTYSVDIPTLDCISHPINSTVTVTLTVSDGNLSSSCTTDILILNNPPVPYCQDITVELDATGNYVVQANELDNNSVDQCNDPLSFLISLDNTNFAATATLDCTNLGTVAAELQVADAAGMTANCTANITVEDNIDAMALCGTTAHIVTLDSLGIYNFNAADSTLFQGLFSDNCDLNIGLDVTSFDCSDVDATGTTLVTAAVVDMLGNAVLDMNGDSIACEVNVTILDDIAPIVSCTDITVEIDGSGDFVLNAEDLIGGSLFFESGNNGSGTLGYDEICITTTNATTFGFDYIYGTTDTGGAGVVSDQFGYSINGLYTEIVGPNQILPNTVSITLSAGDLLCLRMATVDNLNGSATVTVENITPGLIGDFAIANWNAPTSQNSDGGLFFNDACGIDRYELFNVGIRGSQWTETEIFDCEDIALMIDTLCGPQTKQFALQAIDVNGNISDFCLANVTFIDKQPPVPVCESKTISLSTGAIDVPADLFDDGSYDACAEIAPTRFAIARPAPGDGIYQDELTFGCDSIGVFPLSLRVEDCSGNQAFCNVTITVQESQPPKIHCSPDITIDCSINPDPAITGYPTLVMDACSATVDTTFADVYDGASFACSAITRTWTATDASGNQSSCAQIITTIDTIAPTFVVPADITLANCEDPNSFAITGFPSNQLDDCDARPRTGIHDAGFIDSYSFGNWIYYQNAQSPTGNAFGHANDSLQIFGSNDILTCPSMPAPDTIQNNVSITVPFDGDISFEWCYITADSAGPSDDPFGYILNGTFTQLSGAANIASGFVTVTVAAGDVFEFSQRTYTSSCGGATSTIKNFRAPQGCNSTFVRTWSLTDRCGNNTEHDQLVTIDITTPPTITYPNAIQAVTGGSGTCSGPAVIDFSNAVTGNCGEIIITNDALANYGVGDGMEDASGNYPVGTNIVTFTVTSGLGCFAQETHVVTVDVIDNTSPFLTCTNSQQTVVLNSAGQGALLTTSNLYSAADDCGISNVSVAPVTFDCTDIGTPPNVTLTVTDAAGNSNSCNLNVAVIASSNTTLTCPANVTVDCSDFTAITDNFGTPVTGGVCGGANAFVVSNTITSGTLGDCFEFERVWSDGASTCTQTITIEDTIDPVLDAAPADTTITFSDPNLPTTLNFTDNCAANGTVTSIDDTSNQGPDPCLASFYNFDITRYWLATDNCGNIDSVAQIITIQDDSIPTFSFPNPMVIPNDQGVCGAQVDLTISNFIADDAPFTCLTITNDGLTNHGNGNGTDDIDGFYAVGTYAIEFMVTDPSGNTSMETLNLEIEDVENVALPCFGFISLNLDNTGNASITPANVLNGTVMDNCGNTNFTLSLSDTDFNCTNIGPTNTTTLTATDQSGNQNTCTVTVNVFSPFINIGFSTSTSSTPASNLLATDGTASVEVTGGSDSYSYLWDDPNGTTDSVATGLLPGLYTVTITDNNTGCVQIDQAVVASLCPTFTLGQTAGGPGDVVSIPVTIDNFTNIVSFQFTMNVNPNVAQFIGASGFTLPGLTTSNFSPVSANSTTMTVSWIDPQSALGPGTTLAPGSTVFNLDFVISGGAGNSTFVYINSTPLDYEIGQFLNGNVVSVPGCTNNDGNVSINTSLALSDVCGRVTLEDGTPVENVDVFETAGSGLTDITDVNGDNCIQVSGGTPVTLEPFKNNNHFGASSIDLYLIQQHILGNSLLTSPYQVIAADANNNGSVSTLDLLDIQFLILGNYSMYPNNDFWRFVDANQTFTNPLSPFPFNETIALGPVNASTFNNDFIAVAIGDVNGSANVQRPDVNTALRGEQSFDLQIDNQSVKKGEAFEITFTASAYADIAGYQTTLEFANDAMQFEAIETLHIDNLKASNFSINDASNGNITLNWVGLQTRDFKEGEALFTLKFTALKDAETLKGLLTSTSNVTKAEAYKLTNNQLEYLDVNLIFNDNIDTKSDFTLLDNRPNPFKNETTIGFMLPNDSEATITVYDVSGRILIQINEEFTKGYNEKIINASELDGSGILYYEVKTDKNTATGRMILLK